MSTTSIAGALSGSLIGLGPLLLVFAFSEMTAGWTAISLASALSCFAISLSGFFLERLPRVSRTLGTLGTIALLAVIFQRMMESPALALLWMIMTVVLLGIFFGLSSVRSLVLSRFGQSSPVLSSFRTCAWFALATWFSAAIASVQHGYSDKVWWAALLSVSFCYLFGLKWLFTERRNRLSNLVWFSVSLLGLIGSAVSLSQSYQLLSTVWMLFPISVLFFAKEEHEDIAGSITDLVFEHPARLLVLTFLGLCLLGSFLLALPTASATQQPIAYIDALFTAVSAVCVTGLVVVDTPTAFNFFGQFLILLLIQVGALGIMTFYTAAFALFRRRFSVRHERAVLQVVGEERRGEVFQAIKNVLLVTLISEALGAAILGLLFARSGATVFDAAWGGIFTAVSAFGNAGFGLRTDSLVSFQNNIPILTTVSSLIIIGGLSPAVVVAVPELLRRKPVALQTKLILWVTLVLLVAGTLAFAAFEWTNSLTGLSFFDKFANAWFQAVTVRTAGFNSLDISTFSPSTLTLMMALMFVGGSPGGTAGGIKTTTFALLLMATVGIFRGHPRIHLLGRHVSHLSLYRSVAVLITSLSAGLLTLIALFLTQEISPKELVFETVSALGTVGLSIGATAKLDSVGKVIVMVCMFFGRVGPLTVLLSLSSVRPERTAWLPKEEVTVG